MRANVSPDPEDRTRTEPASSIVRGPEDLIAWARRRRIGWEERAVLTVVLGEYGDIVGVRRLASDLDGSLVGCPSGAGPGKHAVLLVCRPGEPTLAAEADVAVVDRLAVEWRRAGGALLDCLVVSDHRWRSVRGGSPVHEEQEATARSAPGEGSR